MKLKLLLFSMFLSGAYQAGSAQWDSISAYPGTPTDGCFSFTIGNKAYVGGGLSNAHMYSYDAAMNKWSNRATVPGGTARGWAGAFSYNGKGYVIGGIVSQGVLSDGMYCYNPDSNKWTPKAPFPGGQRDGLLTFVAGDKAYAGGGFDGNYILNDFYAYNFSTNTWSSLGNLPDAMLFPSVFVLNGKAYMTFWESSASHNKLYCYDPSNDSWTLKTACPGAVRSAGIGFALNGKGYCGMGQTDLQAMQQDFYQYNPVNDSWKKLPDFQNDQCGWSTAFVLGNKAYIGTGVRLPDFAFTNKFYSIDDGVLSARDDIKKAVLHIYPNPAGSEFYIECKAGSRISLYDMSGRILMEMNTESDKTMVNAAGIKSGLYMIRVENGGISTNSMISLF